MGQQKGKKRETGSGNRERVLFQQVFLRLLHYTTPHKRLLMGISMMVILSTGLGLVPPYLIRYGVDTLIMESRPEGLWLIALLMVLVTLIQGVADFFKRYLAESLAQETIHSIRYSLYQHIHSLSFLFYDKSQTGDTLSRLTTDAQSLHRFLSFFGLYMVSNTLTISGVFVILMVWEVQLGLVYLLLLPFMVHAMCMYATRVQPLFRKARQRFASLTSLILESLSGILVMKLFHQEEQEIDGFIRENQSYVEVIREEAKISAFWMPYVHFLLGVATAFVLWHGGRLVIHSRISIGTLIGFTSYMALLMRPIRQTGMMMSAATQAIAAGDRIFSFLDIEPEVKDAPHAIDLPPLQGRVEYRDVSFSYGDEGRVLKNITFTVYPGETVAIVGPTGAGKSTLLHLLPRFYDPKEGEILLDGHWIQKVRLQSLRRQVGIVLQEPFLFSVSIKENISYGAPEASMEDIVEAARRAQIHDSITSLPLGYETLVGERGVNLSGGERQRLAMARVLLTDPRLLILDEPTSSLDSATEGKIQEALSQLFLHRTTFVVAHRIWTVQRAHRILVIDRGVLVEEGSHEELIHRKGLYRELYKRLLYRDLEGGIS